MSRLLTIDREASWAARRAADFFTEPCAVPYNAELFSLETWQEQAIAHGLDQRIAFKGTKTRALRQPATECQQVEVFSCHSLSETRDVLGYDSLIAMTAPQLRTPKLEPSKQTRTSLLSADGAALPLVNSDHKLIAVPSSLYPPTSAQQPRDRTQPPLHPITLLGISSSGTSCSSSRSTALQCLVSCGSARFSRGYLYCLAAIARSASVGVRLFRLRAFGLAGKETVQEVWRLSTVPEQSKQVLVPPGLYRGELENAHDWQPVPSSVPL